MNKRVVITGMGIYSCIGVNLEEVRQSLFEGKSGIVIDRERVAFGFQSPLTGTVPAPDLKKVLNRRQRISMGEESEYAYMATTEALAQAKLEIEDLNKREVGILFGNDSVSKAVIDATDIVREKKDTQLIGSGAIFKSMNSTVTMNLATIFGLSGINMTISAACASGSHALGLGYMFIQQGLQDMIICGGAQEINPYAMASFDGLGVFATDISHPQQASRPFDKRRTGLVPSGGAAAVILESYESAINRGAPIIAEILGYGFSSNGGHISTPNIEGPAKAMRRALEQADIRAADIGYINAHATSTPIGDANEAKAILEVFGDRPYVSSTKSMTGHECWMAGASEIVYSTLMMQHGFIAPNINLEDPDDDIKELNFVSRTIKQEFDIYLSNSFGFGGTNSALVVKKFNDG
ncbi:beta-ketoacyl-[acyl-carrier-protein] synthase family protein [Sphingobacterium arenae]|uniref:3-oxoacyl-[acyl-carrier-protein] synthase 1 n=1 Tax=Sphingobacterium arenae TaxID=1280598 RepID=A0ABR7XZB6_9SPHI|nr:beta-ketoacyl-[acyl-carrier-protein] synthase family protein [Sphingobacterium arenae]MBD1424372.1 beta-ketoacyl-[acyl-carrier-protein] synthase family protein [Sphingobacterium arenae]HLT86430.1 beta-ketoacyl-[acyl-carrier-protein] synthase family protein [Sphingobacterium sp.]